MNTVQRWTDWMGCQADERERLALGAYQKAVFATH
jgi:hypothetical protein